MWSPKLVIINKSFVSKKNIPSLAGESETTTPAASKALILSDAPPLPPEIIAPAWPVNN